MLAGVIVSGGVVLWLLGDGRWTLLETTYFALICASTVGLGEPKGLAEVPHARVVTGLVIVTSLVVVAYFQSILTTYLVQDVIGHQLRRRRMQKRIEGLKDHVIVAGAGSVGSHVIEELSSMGTQFVVIDRSKSVIEAVTSELPKGDIHYVVGDATHDAVLTAAGIERASGVIAALTEDKDNLYVTLTARELNPKIRIVSKVVQPEAVRKMVRAGADATVAPSRIGGLRMASEMIRPTAVAFLDKMLHASEHRLRIEELAVVEGSWVIGKPLEALPITHKDGVLTLALYVGDALVPTPDPKTILDGGMTLIVVGEIANIERLRRALTSAKWP